MLSDIVVIDKRDPKLSITYESVSYQFGIGLIAANYYNYHSIISSWQLPKELPGNYVVAKYTDPIWKYHSRELSKVFEESSIQSLSTRYQELINSYRTTISDINIPRYTCIDVRDKCTRIYGFDHLDFLVGLANGHMNMTSIIYVIKLKIFDRYQLCDVDFKIIKARDVDDIIDTIKHVLEYVLVSDVISVIKQYCTSTPTTLNLLILNLSQRTNISIRCIHLYDVNRCNCVCD